MTQPPIDQEELPSTRQLVRSTIVAALVAALLLVCVVMPAEYGIDPTGVGDMLGLKRMGEIKTSLAVERSTTSPPPSAPVSAPNVTSTSAKKNISLTLLPDQSTEVKLTMKKGDAVQYTWRAQGGEAIFDLHADSGELGIDYHKYQKGRSQQESGMLVAAFDGSHGWFWRNRSPNVMVITLDVEGKFGGLVQH